MNVCLPFWGNWKIKSNNSGNENSKSLTTYINSVGTVHTLSTFPTRREGYMRPLPTTRMLQLHLPCVLAPDGMRLSGAEALENFCPSTQFEVVSSVLVEPVVLLASRGVPSLIVE